MKKKKEIIKAPAYKIAALLDKIEKNGK